MAGTGISTLNKAAKVVDLAQFRAARERKALPLFDSSEPAVVAVYNPPRSLSGREVEHRTRMLKHLGGRPPSSPSSR